MTRQPPEELWEKQLHMLARSFRYPPTPQLRPFNKQGTAARRAAPRGLLSPRRVAAILVAAALTTLLGVPRVRAGVLGFLRIGAIEIEVPGAMATAEPSQQASPTATLPIATPVRSLVGLVGESTLADARRRMPLPILLPTYPPELGPPDRVFVQDLGGPAVVLVWLDPQDAERVALSLQILSEEGFGRKSSVVELEQTTVNGRPAAWVRGRHLLQFEDSNGQTRFDLGQLVDGNVLIWSRERSTYRLETELSLPEAIKVAESLR